MAFPVSFNWCHSGASQFCWQAFYITGTVSLQTNWWGDGEQVKKYFQWIWSRHDLTHNWKWLHLGERCQRHVAAHSLQFTLLYQNFYTKKYLQLFYQNQVDISSCPVRTSLNYWLYSDTIHAWESIGNSVIASPIQKLYKNYVNVNCSSQLLLSIQGCLSISQDRK